MKTEKKNNKLKIEQVIPCFFIRSLTNNNDKAKQYFFVAESKDYSPCLIIKKLVLSKDLELHRDHFEIIKQFNDYYLFEQRFSIKIETLKTVIYVLNKYNINI